ncbi:LysR substrate-binding domain-containing protein [Roseovarius confluentis]|uniref:LysR substrate-binding domain-containing protein n=1 Tax=Roseovarius confluentis TaxID=1852027 RepID=UPI0014738942|nr:LysR substrate-binding domain-containing protein [Roseovarius confluentis]
MNASRSTPPLTSLRAFEAFSRHGLVREAAEELSISHTVVSRHIQNVEYFLKVKLVQKSGRNIVLTKEGLRYAQQIRRAFGIIVAASAELQRKPENTLHISCKPGLATRRILGMLSEIESRIGVRNLTLQPQLLGADMLKDGADVELTYSETVPDIPGLTAEIFASPRIIAVASPTFMDGVRGEMTLDMLSSLPLIHEKNTRQWENWLTKAGMTQIPELQGVKLWQGNLSIEGARYGQGVALVSTLIAQPALKKGHIVEVIPSDVRLGDYYMMASEQTWKRAEVLELLDFLRSVFADE